MILSLIGYTIFVVIMFTGDWENNFCADNYGDFDDYYDSPSECVDWINTVLIVVVITSALIFIPCAYCCIQVLYYGWKELEMAIEREGRAANAPFNPNQQNVLHVGVVYQ